MVITSSSTVDLPPIADVIFLVEATSRLEHSFADLRTNYLIPVLGHFNPAINDELDTGIDYNCNLYTLVTFTTQDLAPPAPIVRCSLPTQNTHEVLELFNGISYGGCTGPATSHITEALARCLKVFDDCAKIRSELAPSSERHVVLVCNSVPYDVPSREPAPYRGLMAKDITMLFAERKIHLSIVCPRRLPKLFALYKSVCNPTMPLKNYSTDPRHHVLMDGIILKEQQKIEQVEVIEIVNSPKPAEPEPEPPKKSILVDQVREMNKNLSGSNTIAKTSLLPSSGSSNITTAPSVAPTIAPPPPSTQPNTLTDLLTDTSSSSPSIQSQVTIQQNPSLGPQSMIRTPAPMVTINQQFADPQQAAPVPSSSFQQIPSQPSNIQHLRPVMASAQQSGLPNQQLPLPMQRVTPFTNRMPTPNINNPNLRQAVRQPMQNMPAATNTMQAPSMQANQRPAQQPVLPNQMGNRPMNEQIRQPQPLQMQQPMQPPSLQQPMQQSQSAHLQPMQPAPPRQMMHSQPPMPQPPQKIPMPQQQHSIIWSGILEIPDKKASLAGQEPPLTIQMQLHALSQDLEMFTRFPWPDRVSVTMIPTTILSSNQKLLNLLGDACKLQVATDRNPVPKYWEFLSNASEKNLAALINNNAAVMVLLIGKNPGPQGSHPNFNRALYPKQQQEFFETFKQAINAFRANAAEQQKLRMMQQQQQQQQQQQAKMNPGMPPMSQQSSQMMGGRPMGAPIRMPQNPTMQQMPGGQRMVGHPNMPQQNMMNQQQMPQQRVNTMQQQGTAMSQEDEMSSLKTQMQEIQAKMQKVSQQNQSGMMNNQMGTQGGAQQINMSQPMQQMQQPQGGQQMQQPLPQQPMGAQRTPMMNQQQRMVSQQNMMPNQNQGNQMMMQQQQQPIMMGGNQQAPPQQMMSQQQGQQSVMGANSLDELQGLPGLFKN